MYTSLYPLRIAPILPRIQIVLLRRHFRSFDPRQNLNPPCDLNFIYTHIPFPIARFTHLQTDRQALSLSGRGLQRRRTQNCRRKLGRQSDFWPSSVDLLRGPNFVQFRIRGRLRQTQTGVDFERKIQRKPIRAKHVDVEWAFRGKAGCVPTHERDLSLAGHFRVPKEERKGVIEKERERGKGGGFGERTVYACMYVGGSGRDRGRSRSSAYWSRTRGPEAPGSRCQKRRYNLKFGLRGRTEIVRVVRTERSTISTNVY